MHTAVSVERPRVEWVMDSPCDLQGGGLMDRALDWDPGTLGSIPSAPAGL